MCKGKNVVFVILKKREGWIKYLFMGEKIYRFVWSFLDELIFIWRYFKNMVE